MNNTINLEFEKTLVGLAANPFGKNVFKEQVEGKVDEDERVIIVFPDRVMRIASSFVQGFFSFWIDRHGVEWVKKNVDVRANNDELVKSVYDNLE